MEKFAASWPTLPRPWFRAAAALGIIFAAEYGLMFVLPWLFPRGSAYFHATIDAALLVVVAFPLLWWTVVRPLRQAARLRDHFLADLFSTIEDERRRIAHELHDGVGQTLTLLLSGLRSLNTASGAAEIERREAECRQLAQRALADAKRLALGLRPSLLDDLGLAAAIERVAAEVEEHSHLRVAVDVQAMTGQRLPEKVETALFRIFQEAISNMVRHAGASLVSVRLTREPHRVTMNLGDNGCGIEAQAAIRRPDGSGHLGLVGMYERAALLGGSFEISSGEGSGTNITVTIPL